jgi:hypothetical protein
MKKYILSLILVVAASVFFADTTNALDATITVDDTHAVISQQYLFQHDNIGPGFISNSTITIVNNATSTAEMKLISVDPVDEVIGSSQNPANSLLPYAHLSLLRDGVVLAHSTAADTTGLVGATVCIPANTTVPLTARFELPASIGNVAQDTSMSIKATFQVTVEACSIVAPPSDPTHPTDPTNPIIRPPNTAETMLPLLVLGGTFVVAFFVALICALLLLISVLRKKQNESKANR